MKVVCLAGLLVGWLVTSCAGQGQEREPTTLPARGNPSAPNDPRAEARAAGAGPGAAASADPGPVPGDADVGALGPAAPTGGGLTLAGERGAYGGYGAGPADLDQPTPKGGGPIPNARVGLPEQEPELLVYDSEHVCGRLTACFGALEQACRSGTCRTRYDLVFAVPEGRCAAVMARGLEDAPSLLPRGVSLPPVCSSVR